MEEGVVERSWIQKVGWPSIVFGVLILVIALTFFIMLANVSSLGLAPGEENPNAFGIGEVLFSLVVAVFAGGFFMWLQQFMQHKPYVGLTIGLITLGALVYSLFLQFRGFYTNIFAGIISLVTLVFLGIYFFQGKKKALQDMQQPHEDFDDSVQG